MAAGWMTVRHILPEQLPADATAREVLGRFCREAHRRAPGRVERVIVYGSMARGEAGPGSDLDLWVDWNGDEHEGRRILGDLGADLFLETGLLVSVHVVDAEHRRRLRELNASFYQCVQREGLLVES